MVEYNDMDRKWKDDAHFLDFAPPPPIQSDRPEAVEGRVLQKIQDALQPYRKEWMDGARNEHTLYYHNIHKRLDYARAKCAEIDSRLEELYALNIGDEVTPEIRKLESLRRPHLTVTRAVAAQFNDAARYVQHVTPRLEDEYRQALTGLAGRCGLVGLDSDRMSVSCVAVKPHSVTLSFTQNGMQGFDATVSISKASPYSAYRMSVAP